MDLEESSGGDITLENLTKAFEKSLISRHLQAGCEIGSIVAGREKTIQASYFMSDVDYDKAVLDEYRCDGCHRWLLGVNFERAELERGILGIDAAWCFQCREESTEENNGK
jgi:hypothetical protein